MVFSGPSPRLLVRVVVVALLVGLSGCGKHDPETAPTPGPTSPAVSDSPTPSESPTESASPSESPSESPSGSPSGTPTAAPDQTTLLLPAGGLPGFTETWSWSEKRTAGQRGPLGVCQRFPMDAIGAEKTVVRSYVPAGDLTGGTGAHLVSRFVDAKSVAQAVSVLHTWHDRCKERLTGYGFSRVSPVRSVSTSKGSATSYLVTYTKKGADAGTFEAIGVLQSGTTVELVQLKLRGQDYPGPDPIVKALQNAADRLP